MNLPPLADATQQLFSFIKRYWKWSFLLLIFVIAFLLKHYSTNDFFEKDYKIGQDHRWVGVGLQGKERTFSAFNGDLFAKVGQIEGIHMHIVAGDLKELIKELENKKIDGVLTTHQAGVLPSADFVFSNSYYLIGPVLVIPKGKTLTEWNEIGNKTIGIPAKSPVMVDLEKNSTVHVKTYEDILDAFADLSKGRIDGAIFPAIPAHVYALTFYTNELQIASLPLNDEGIRLMALKNEDGTFLINAFNDALKKLKEDGTYQELLDRWGLVNGEKLH